MACSAKRPSAVVLLQAAHGEGAACGPGCVPFAGPDSPLACANLEAMLRRCLLVLLFFAVPLQGALAASRVCLGMMHSGTPAIAVDASHDHHSQGVVADSNTKHQHGEHHASPGADHAAGSCSLCAACCFTVAVAPPAPQLSPVSATYAGHRPLVVSVPHYIADGLERPPRTI